MTIMTVRGRPGQNGLALAGWLMAGDSGKRRNVSTQTGTEAALTAALPEALSP